MGIVRAIQKGEQPAGKFSKAAQKAAKSMKKSSVKKYAKTKHDDLPTKKESYDFKKAHKKFKETGELPPHLKKMVKDLDKMEKKYKVKNIVVPGLEWMSKIKESLEEAERDYKDEYKKFQSSTKAKKYRAELNKYNRQKGTYGNGDGKDASHKGGKIVGFESQSKNRGRAEKSRLKKEYVKEAVSPKGWNMSKKYITFIAREVKNLAKYHRQQNEEDFLEVANYIELQIKQMKKNLNESMDAVKEIKDSDLISKLRSIVKDRQNKVIKDPKSGRKMRVDGYTANAIIKVYDALNNQNKKKFANVGLMKMQSIAFKFVR